MLSCAAVPLFSSGSLPPACAQCLNTLQLAAPGSLPQESPWSLLRSAEGKLRLNYGSMSIITDPRAGVRMLLDHLAQTVRITPLTPPNMPQAPGMPQMAVPGFGLPGLAGLAMPGVPGGSVQNLGKSIMDGLEVMGKRYISGARTLETWTSTKLQLPVLTTMSGAFGQQTCRCKTLPTPPDPSAFQIPPGYTQLPPR